MAQQVTTDSRLARLEAIEAIRYRIGEYAYGGDRKNDPDILGPLFTDDAIWNAEGFGSFEGRANIVEGLSGIARDKVLWSLHFPASPMIDVSDDGQSASAYWWLWELATVRGDSGGEDSSFMGGTYKGKLVKVGGKWLFSRIDLRMETMTPFPGGWVFPGQDQ